MARASFKLPNRAGIFMFWSMNWDSSKTYLTFFNRLNAVEFIVKRFFEEEIFVKYNSVHNFMLDTFNSYNIAFQYKKNIKIFSFLQEKLTPCQKNIQNLYKSYVFHKSNIILSDNLNKDNFIEKYMEYLKQRNEIFIKNDILVCRLWIFQYQSSLLVYVRTLNAGKAVYTEKVFFKKYINNYDNFKKNNLYSYYL